MSESMPWLRQVWHVFAKDVRRHWWMLLLFVAHAFAGTLGATLPAYAMGKSLTLGLLFFSLPITATVLAAMVVLDDPPVSASAWWPTLALSRQAVFAAKLLFVLGLMPLTLIVAMISMHLSLDVPIAEAIVYAQTGVRWIVLLLMVTVAVAALVKDLRAFVLAAVLMLCALYFLLDVLLRTSDGILENLTRHTPNAYSLAMILLVVLLILATARVYRNRSQTWYRVAIVLLLAPALLLVQIKAAAATVRPDAHDQSGMMEQAILETEVRRTSSGGERNSQLLARIRLRGLAPNVQAAFHLPGLQISGGPACRRVITLGEPFSVLQTPALPIPGDRVTWRGTAPDNTYSGDSVYTRTWGPFANVSESCTLNPRSELHIRQPRLLGSVPVRMGASLTRDGYRVSLLGVNGEAHVRLAPLDARGWLTIGEVSSLSAPRESSDDRRSLAYALVHPIRREAVQLQTAYYYSFAQRGPVSQVVTNLAPRDAGATPEAISATSSRELQQFLGFASEREFDAWLRGAELLVFEWKLLAVIDLEPSTTGAIHVRTDSTMSGIR